MWSHIQAISISLSPVRSTTSPTRRSLGRSFGRRKLKLNTPGMVLNFDLFGRRFIALLNSILSVQCCLETLNERDLEKRFSDQRNPRSAGHSIDEIHWPSQQPRQLVVSSNGFTNYSMNTIHQKLFTHLPTSTNANLLETILLLAREPLQRSATEHPKGK